MILIENFNTTNETIPTALNHFHFVIDIKERGCQKVEDVPFEQRCEFVEKTHECNEGIQFVNYINFLYCTIQPRSEFVQTVGVFVILLFCCYMFLGMGTCADKFFVPSLTMVSQLMKLSENVAGVTILAFGNGSPDLFTSFSTIHGETAMLYSELIGAATFIVSIIAGTLLAIQPFELFPAHFLRDILFFLFAVLFIDWAMFTNESVNIYESCTILAIYVVYLLVVIIDQVLVNRLAHEGTSEVKYKDQTTLEFVSKRSNASVTLGEFAKANFVGTNANEKIFVQFLNSINPIDAEEWEESGWFFRMVAIVKAPLLFGLLILIPIVDYEVEAHGWSKLLNCIQVVILPFIIAFIKVTGTCYGIPIYALVPIAALPFAILIFFTSRTDQAPKYHPIFALMCIVGSIFVIWILANEVVQMLETIGIVLQMSPSLLGCTILAWGNSIGDLIANTALARQGYVKMGFAGCYGGPLFNSLLGMGITFLVKCLESDKYEAKIRRGYMGENCSIFLTIILGYSIVAMCFSNFAARRSFGIFLIITYFLFFLYATFSEYEIIHAFGTDHM